MLYISMFHLLDIFIYVKWVRSNMEIEDLACKGLVRAYCQESKMKVIEKSFVRYMAYHLLVR